MFKAMRKAGLLDWHPLTWNNPLQQKNLRHQTATTLQGANRSRCKGWWSKTPFYLQDSGWEVPYRLIPGFFSCVYCGFCLKDGWRRCLLLVPLPSNACNRMLLPGLDLSQSRTLVMLQAMLCDWVHTLLWVLCWKIKGSYVDGACSIGCLCICTV